MRGEVLAVSRKEEKKTFKINSLLHNKCSVLFVKDSHLKSIYLFPQMILATRLNYLIHKCVKIRNKDVEVLTD